MKYKLKQEIEHGVGCGKRLLMARGINQYDIESYLNPEKGLMYSYRNLDNIDIATSTLKKHIDNNSNIFIQVDSDMDGFSSAALMYLYIKKLNPEAKITWRVHEGKQHGIIVDTIPQETNLVIAPDASSNDYEQHKELFDMGIDVLVLDHHMADRESENAIVVNNQLSAHYKNKTLCGAGVVLKFCQALDDVYGVNYSEEFYDLAAAALVADMMDLRDLETRYIVHYGLNHIKNAGLKAFIEKQSYSIGDKLTPIAIAFYIAPLVNAIIRVGSQEEKEILFTAFIDGLKPLPSKKRGAKPGDIELAGEQAARMATNARTKQNKEKERVMNLIKAKIDSEGLNDNAVIWVGLSDEDFTFDNNLTGLVAMQLMQVYKKPVLLTRLSSDGYFRGSARGDSNSELNDLKAFLELTGLFEYTAGHPNAFGLSIKDNNIESFLKYSNNYVSENQIDLAESAYNVDFIYNRNEDCADDILELGKMASLWGQGLEEPLIVIERLRIDSLKLTAMGTNKDTVKLTLPNGLSCIKFKDAKFKEELENNLDKVITILGRANMNEWCGQVSPQLFIVDYNITFDRLEF